MLRDLLGRHVDHKLLRELPARGIRESLEDRPGIKLLASATQAIYERGVVKFLKHERQELRHFFLGA